MMSAAAMPVNPGVALDDAPAYETQTHAVRDLRSLEAELSRGLLDEWRRVVDEDPLASLYQTAGWCMPWYRCYQQTYDPYVLVVASRGRMVGLVPMAVHRETGDHARGPGRLEIEPASDAIDVEEFARQI